MKFKIYIISFCFLLNNALYIYSLERFKPTQLTVSVDNQDCPINLREAQESDFEEIYALCVKTFVHAYKFTTKEQVDLLKKTYDLIIPDELDNLKQNYQTMVATVAVHNNKIIAYFSANLTNNTDEIYARFLAVDPDFQHKNIAKNILKCCRDLLPNLKRVVCLTKKQNIAAQKLYEYFLGKRVEDPAWKCYLYKNLNAQDYIGYEFDESAIFAFDKRWANKNTGN